MPPTLDRPPAAPALRPSLPLAHRLPNPPPVFVGRDDEARALAELVTRAPVTHVQGLGGLGKSALVAHTLHRLLPDRAARCFVVRLRPGADLRAVLVDVVRALAAAEGVHLSDWQAHLSEPDLALATALDHADAGRWTVVLEDLHHLPAPADRAALLEPLATYARDARWIATSREAPPAGLLPGQELTLGPLSPAGLTALAAHWAPDRPDADRRAAVADSAGAPWRLRQALFGQPLAPATPAERDPLGGLSPDARAALGVLALLDRPLPEATLATLPQVSRPALDLLLRSGHLETTGGGLAAHGLSRSLATEHTPAPARAALARALVAPLAAAPAPEAQLEALRLSARHAPDALPATALAVTPTLVAEGFAPEAWALLASADAALPLALRLRLALDAGDLDAAVALGPLPDAAPPEAELAWVRVLYATNRFPDAARRGAQLAATAPPDLANEAALFAGRASLVLGQAADALALVDPPRPAPDPTTRLLLEDIRICACNALGRAAEARALARGAMAEFETATPRVRRQVGHYLVRSLYMLGLLPEASRLLARTLDELGPRALSLQVGRGALFSEAVISLENGRLAAAAAATERLPAYFPPSAGAWRAMVDALALQVTLFSYAFAPARIADVMAAGERFGARSIVAAARMQQARWALETGAPLSWDDQALAGDDPHNVIARGWKQVHAARHGQADPAALQAPSDAAGEAAFLRRLASAAAAFVAGDVASAAAQARETAELADTQGYGLLAPEAFELLAWTDAAQGRLDALEAAAARLLATTEAMPAPRLAARARLLLAAARGDLPALFALAQRPDCAAARRARALLGAPAPLDRAEQRLIQALRPLLPTPAPAWLGPTDGPPDWLLDLPAGRVLPAAGDPIDLTRTPQLLRFLSALADAGGEASKETLVGAAWDIADYHPLHHDNRLRIAARKLRQLIEPDPTAPTRLLTTEDGYRLGGRVLVLS